jgi:capsular polysaccharide biosynthesis protein
LIVVKSRRTGTNMDEIVSPQGVRWLRERALQHLPAKSYEFKKRVFLSRQHTNCRRIVNFEELKPILEKYDFQIVDADDLNIAEQVQLFNDVEVLFTVHGAGLTNIIFSQKLKILELIGNVDRPNDFQWYCAYYSMSQALNLDYSFLECEALSVFDGEQMKQFYDVKVDLGKVERMLALVTN